MSPRKGAAEIAVSRTDEVLTLRMLSEGVVYELSEDIGLGCWEARHWEEGADVAELSAGDTEQRAMSGFFPEPIEEEFEAELSRRSVRDVRMEPLARFRGLLDQGRWHEASQLGVRIAMDPYVSAGPGEREGTRIWRRLLLLWPPTNWRSRGRPRRPPAWEGWMSDAEHSSDLSFLWRPRVRSSRKGTRWVLPRLWGVVRPGHACRCR